MPNPLEFSSKSTTFIPCVTGQFCCKSLTYVDGGHATFQLIGAHERLVHSALGTERVIIEPYWRQIKETTNA
jgi:hypothetical protein